MHNLNFTGNLFVVHRSVPMKKMYVKRLSIAVSYTHLDVYKRQVVLPSGLGGQVAVLFMQHNKSKTLHNLFYQNNPFSHENYSDKTFLTFSLCIIYRKDKKKKYLNFDQLIIKMFLITI